MTVEKVKAQVQGDEGEIAASAEVNYDFGDNLEGAVVLFGEDAVFKRFRASARVDLQGVIRRLISGNDPLKGKKLQDKVDEWKPGAKREVKSAQEKAMELIGSMSDEDRAALLESLTS